MTTSPTSSSEQLPPAVSTVSAADPFDWTDAFLLGYGPMDRTHEEFVTCVNAMLQAPDEALPQALEAFAIHARRHFSEEEEWMNSTGFPAAECHADEHTAVANSVTQVQQALAGGAKPALVRELAQALVNWFPGHADYMDASLSQWMVKRTHGGAPVVLRRHIDSHVPEQPITSSRHTGPCST